MYLTKKEDSLKDEESNFSLYLRLRSQWRKCGTVVFHLQRISRKYQKMSYLKGYFVFFNLKKLIDHNLS
jgi:hypothetical protein